MNAMQIENYVRNLEIAGLPKITGHRNERGLARAEKARFYLIQKLRANLAEQIMLDPNESAFSMHAELLRKAYTCTDANLWQSGEEFVLS